MEQIKFISLLKNTSGIISKFLDIILEILSELSNQAKDFRTRIEALEVLNKAITNKEQNLDKHSSLILNQILFKSLVWQIGKPNNKIRKAGVVCFLGFLKSGICPKKSLEENFYNITPLLKSCSEDDWVAELRYLSLELLSEIITILQQELTREQLMDIYPIILERLDDA